MIYVHILNRKDGAFELIDGDFLQLYPEIAPADLVELSDEQYADFCVKDNGRTKFLNGQFVYEQTAIDEVARLEMLRNSLVDSVDNRASEIYSHWTRFTEEYKNRLADSVAYRDAGYEGEVGRYLHDYAIYARKDFKTAANVVLMQAQGLERLQVELAAQRMRKFAIQQPGLTEEQMTDIYNDIMRVMNQLEEAYRNG